jgi:hypothetical protein
MGNMAEQIHVIDYRYTVKTRLPIFLSLSGMSLTKLSLERKNLIIPGQEEFC